MESGSKAGLQCLKFATFLEVYMSVSPLTASPLLPVPALAPHRYLSDKIKAVLRRVFGFLLRVLLFQVGERNRKGAGCVIRTHHHLTCDPNPPLNLERLKQSQAYFEAICGQEIAHTVQASDGLAEVHLLHLRSSVFWANVENMGGRRCDYEVKNSANETVCTEVIACGDNAELIVLLKKFFFEIQIKTIEGKELSVALLPKRPLLPAGETLVVDVCHSPGRSMLMERRIAGLHIAWCDVCLWDPRGTIDSTGTPSEGGYYLDAEAVYQHLAQSYRPDQIYLLGYCGGAATAAYVKKLHHADGVHFIAQNPFHNLKAALEKFPKPFSSLGIMSIDAIKSKDEATRALVVEDGFDIVEKFKGLTASKGKFVIIHTDTDKMMPKEAVPEILKIAKATGSYVIPILRIHPDRKANGHMQPPVEDPKVWEQYITIFIGEHATGDLCQTTNLASEEFSE